MPLAIVDPVEEGEEFGGRAAKPVQLADRHYVAGLERGHELGELMPVRPGAADLLAVDALSASGLQLLDLTGEVLVLGADPGVSDDGHWPSYFASEICKP